MIKYIIVDDEHIAHDIIKGYCDNLPNLVLVKSCYDAIEAIEYIQNNSVDLIFLDLNMPKLKGFEFLRTVQNPPNVIVTTAYQEYALEGYELNILDYLLKPFSFERFLKAINKVNTNKNTLDTVQTLEEESLFLKTNKKHIQVKIETILFIEAERNYVKVVSTNNEIQVRGKISDINNLLPENNFIQIHKSFIVAKKHIQEIEGNRVVIQGYTLPIGNVYKHNFKQFLK
ncbi:LytR/AlgR family response regulator transcription factor [Tenacibaculum geojense]|uniref:LytR/AlgR family response regulator transcription factor n=1 Tax=Tenacibaculum geojense TaxID=915352 RepID=A0ABW3JN03_9FLAO